MNFLIAVIRTCAWCYVIDGMFGLFCNKATVKIVDSESKPAPQAEA